MFALLAQATPQPVEVTSQISGLFKFLFGDLNITIVLFLFSLGVPLKAIKQIPDQYIPVILWVAGMVYSAFVFHPILVGIAHGAIYAMIAQWLYDKDLVRTLLSKVLPTIYSNPEP